MSERDLVDIFRMCAESVDEATRVGEVLQKQFWDSVHEATKMIATIDIEAQPPTVRQGDGE